MLKSNFGNNYTIYKINHLIHYQKLYSMGFWGFGGAKKV